MIQEGLYSHCGLPWLRTEQKPASPAERNTDAAVEEQTQALQGARKPSGFEWIHSVISILGPGPSAQMAQDASNM